ncbi:efflux RND transporter periplasmic adaptor subunit [Cereibacter sp. SYSU M97828]|nr:efflux RND transporter periplasmic adaptor subunit [Cereibacter flavus]
MRKVATQGLAALAMLAAAFAVWALFVPSAKPVLRGWGLIDAAPERAAAVQASASVRVVAEPVVSAAVDDRATAIGDGRPFRTVTVVPEVTGVLATVEVTSGIMVEPGQVIATLRNEAETIARDRAALVLADADRTLTRVEALAGAATELQRIEARLARETAALALREAELQLEKRRITAPISGWLGILSLEPGDQVTPSTAIAQIDDRSSLLVDFRLPERFVARVSERMPVKAHPLSRPDMRLEGAVRAVDNRVDPASRTLLVQAMLPNGDDALRGGMAFGITLDFRGQDFPAVPPLAVQWSADGSFVWTVRDGLAQVVPATIIQRNADKVLVDAALSPGDLVVTEGIQSLRPGIPVALRDLAQGAAPVPAGG